jgi:hypothetical protein
MSDGTYPLWVLLNEGMSYWFHKVGIRIKWIIQLAYQTTELLTRTHSVCLMGNTKVSLQNELRGRTSSTFRCTRSQLVSFILMNKRLLSGRQERTQLLA